MLHHLLGAPPIISAFLEKSCDRALLVTAHFQNALMGPANHFLEWGGANRLQNALMGTCDHFFGLGALIASKMR